MSVTSPELSDHFYLDFPVFLFLTASSRITDGVWLRVINDNHQSLISNTHYNLIFTFSIHPALDIYLDHPGININNDVKVLSEIFSIEILHPPPSNQGYVRKFLFHPMSQLFCIVLAWVCYSLFLF